MAELIYSALMSLDGFIEDRQGGPGRAEPDKAVHAFVDDLVRPRRMSTVPRAYECRWRQVLSPQ